jgi:hypothetical protein
MTRENFPLYVRGAIEVLLKREMSVLMLDKDKDKMRCYGMTDEEGVESADLQIEGISVVSRIFLLQADRAMRHKRCG